MANPYQVLGVSVNATDDEIRDSYRDLLRKYNEELTLPSPACDVAKDKIITLNNAYDEIMNMRRGGTHQTSQFSDIRRYIAQNRTSEADELLKQIREIQKRSDFKEAADAAMRARQKLNEKAKKNSEKLSDSMFKSNVRFKPPKTVKPGDDVEIVKMGQKGVVVAEPDDKGDIMVKVGIMKIKSNLSDIRLVNTPKNDGAKKTRRNYSGSEVSKTMSLSSEIDVRGETVDTACMMIDKFLSDAIISSLSSVLKTVSNEKEYLIDLFLSS